MMKIRADCADVAFLRVMFVFGITEKMLVVEEFINPLVWLG